MVLVAENPAGTVQLEPLTSVTEPAPPAAVTGMPADTPLMLLLMVSVAVTVKVPTVLSFTVNVPTPLLSAEVGGSVAAPSVEVK